MDLDGYNTTSYSDSTYDLANLFLKFRDKNGNIVYNLNDTIEIEFADASSSLYDVYVVKESDTYQTISYKLYGTTRLWWAIAKINDVYDATKLPSKGDVIKTISKSFIGQVIRAIKSQ